VNDLSPSLLKLGDALHRATALDLRRAAVPARLPLAQRGGNALALLHRPGGGAPADHRRRLVGPVRARTGRRLSRARAETPDDPPAAGPRYGVPAISVNAVMKMPNPMQ
jgi:hypothetical protein